jgi:hypothetical protein
MLVPAWPVFFATMLSGRHKIMNKAASLDTDLSIEMGFV